MAQRPDSRYQQIQSEIYDYCTANNNPALVTKYSRYFSEGYDAFGLNDEQVHFLCDKIASEYTLNLEDIAELGLQLFSTGKYEFATVAILLLMKHISQYKKSTLALVKSWFDAGVSNWAHSDILCSRVTPVFLDQSIVSLRDFATWRKAESKWTRRAVPVTLLCLRKTANPQELLDFIACMMADEARVVHQGLGWFLRELWKLHPVPVEEFLFLHKEHCARLIVQYATEKMTPEQKLRFRRVKAKKVKL
jgi:3-methyladenine DNA glycosylase AlkD